MKPQSDKFPVDHIHIDELDSTNNYLRNISSEKSLKEFTTVTAAYQNAGKGQRGNTWEAEKGKNILASILTYPIFLPVKEQFILSQIISLSIKEELDRYADGFRIKWPNDIYWKEQKICGILIENDSSGSFLEKSIIGLGININQSYFTNPLLNAVSIQQITGQEANILKIFSNILKRFISYYEEIRSNPNHSIGEKYYNALYRKEGYHSYQDMNGIFKAKIYGIEPTGIIMLQDEKNEIRRYAFKEVCFLI